MDLPFDVVQAIVLGYLKASSEQISGPGAEAKNDSNVG
jgi:hypothetical protein